MTCATSNVHSIGLSDQLAQGLEPSAHSKINIASKSDEDCTSGHEAKKSNNIDELVAGSQPSGEAFNPKKYPRNRLHEHVHSGYVHFFNLNSTVLRS